MDISLVTICPLRASKPFSVHYTGMSGQNSKLRYVTFSWKGPAFNMQSRWKPVEMWVQGKRFYTAMWMMTFLIVKSIAVHEPKDSCSGCWVLFLPGLIPLAHQVSVFGQQASSWMAETFAWTLTHSPHSALWAQSPRVTHIESCYLILLTSNVCGLKVEFSLKDGK